MKKKHTNDNSEQLKRIKSLMILGYAVIVILTSVLISAVTIKNTDDVLKNKVSELTYSLNVQMKLNINTYLTKLENYTTLAFGLEEVTSYNAAGDNKDEYEALNTEKLISDKLYDLCIMENYVDFFIVYSNGHTVGKVSNGTQKLYEDNLYNGLAATITRERTNDGWSTGYNGDYRRIYYVKKIKTNDALLVASFYTSEVENVFVRPDDMQNTTVRLVSADKKIIYSSANEKSGEPLIPEIQNRIADSTAASIIDDTYLITVNSCVDNWFVICSVPTKIILNERSEVIKSTVIIAAIASVIAIILGAILSINATNPFDIMVNTLDKKAKVDRLTGILNKLSFEESSSEILSSSTEKDHHALILLDVDNFKGVNDTLGHSYGDKVLADIGNILRITFNSSDCLGRIGGDEFCILLNIPPETDMDCEALIHEKCRMLCDAFHNNYTGDDGTYKISASIGVASFPDNGTTFGELYKCADKALYASKHKGKDTYTIYSDMNEETT
ncbi:MAG: diguanylate cyclase domain-containing protein [Huintestinicola sp.]